jgi:hypothetical protein
MRDDDDFKAAFIRQFWNEDSQSRARCLIYQAQTKYHRDDNESMSDHFLRFAELAKFLQPRMTDAELISAMRNHYSVVIQRNWVTAHIEEIQGAVTFLKQMESIEENDPNRKANNNAPNQTDPCEHRCNQHQNFKHQNRGNNNRHSDHIPIRHMQISQQQPNYQNGRRYQQPFFNKRYSQPQDNNREDTPRYRGGNGSNLNPHAPTFDQPTGTRDSDTQLPRPGPSKKKYG